MKTNQAPHKNKGSLVDFLIKNESREEDKNE
ncbi:hypothetical protein Acear_0677 [Acetohalobium arabaticum DSM 5501]|uniref:Uncharacterized protein n=1 Tax=Acetohalobium arabaticum (strain ATCC 49924 / DSM 5501 / Z-7288) TaxID=574087 RepID=D9QVF8_ACEAZ|nr:hypothetical protein Acear_0677 [Acetohalobium arabaticum DSM 5501]